MTEPTDYDHPDHGTIVKRVLDTRVHDNETVYQCERCNTLVPPNEADELFDETDCDHYKKITEGITDTL